jgi:ABC-type glutathione transport system ATPase component
MDTEPLLRVSDLEVTFPARGFGKKPASVIRGVSFDISRGETIGLVGESGSGKTTIGRAILGLAPVTGGSIEFHGMPIHDASRSRRRQVARGIQVVFQDPYSSLNPSMTIEDILTEPLRSTDRKGGRKIVAGLLDAVGLPSDAGSRLAREFSGGQRQRIAIARALALEPELIVCDEPTSALDMTTQTRVLALLREIQERTGVAYLFISHDLGVVRHMSDRTAVLLNGEIVEIDDSETIALHPEHPYTQRLQLATPLPDPVAQEQHRAERHRLLEAQRTLLEHTGTTEDPWSVEERTTTR